MGLDRSGALVTLAGAALAVALASPARGQTLPPAVLAWLECEECVDGELEAVVRLGQAALPGLVASLRDGPPRARAEAYRRHLRKAYPMLADYARRHPDVKVPMSEEEYVKTYLDNYTALYQVRAARALGAIGGDDSRRALEAALARPLREDVQWSVKKALDRLVGP
jgi:hypothetical protein